LLAPGRLPIAGWLVTIAVLSSMWAHFVPSLLTVAFVGGMTAVIAIARGPVARGLMVSIVIAAFTVLAGATYRAGPTSGFEVPNGLLVAAATVTLVVSIADRLRLRMRKA
jgi:hypothetical protein